MLPEDAPDGAEAWRAVLLREYGSYNHGVGTCRMGDDTAAVVGPDLQVHGVEGLTVADASVLPVLPHGNTNYPRRACRRMGSGPPDSRLSVGGRPVGRPPGLRRRRPGRKIVNEVTTTAIAHRRRSGGPGGGIGRSVARSRASCWLHVRWAGRPFCDTAAGGARERRRPGWVRLLRNGILLLLAVLIATPLVGTLVLQRAPIDGSAAGSQFVTPMHVLITGSDSRADLSPEERAALTHRLRRRRSCRHDHAPDDRRGSRRTAVAPS